MRRLLVFLAVLSLTSSAAGGPTRADTAHLRLWWDAPPNCPTALAVAEQAEWMAGKKSENRVQEARGIIEHVAGFELSLRVMGTVESNERRIHADSCAELGDAAAVVLSLAIGDAPLPPAASPARHPEPPPSPPIPEGAPAVQRDESFRPTARAQRSPATQRSRAAVVPETTTDQAVPFYWQSSGSIGLSYILGGPAPVLALAESFGTYDWRVEIRGQWTQRNVPSEVVPGASGRLTLWSAEARPCWVPSASRLRPGLCGILSAGRLEGIGSGTDDNQYARRGWAAAGIGAMIERPFGRRLVLALGVDMLFPFTRPQFWLDTERLYRPASLGGVAWLGLRFNGF